MNNTEYRLLDLINTSWNRRIIIDSISNDHHDIIAVLAISRPLDDDSEKSSSLAYPLTKDDCNAIVEVLEGILGKEN